MYHWKSTDFVSNGTFENAAVGIAHVGFDGAFIRVNQTLLDIIGYDRDALLALTFADITHPDDLDADLENFESLKAGRISSYAMEKRYFRSDGETIWVNLTVGQQKDEQGCARYCISVVEDITDRKRDQEALETLVHELNHRVKNTLSTVQALAHMTFNPDRPVGENLDGFFDRLQSLSNAHDLLTEEKWADPEIKAVVDRALGPFDGNRLSLSGPNFVVSPRVAISLVMALNELATNAVKFGALSGEKGHVALGWTRGDDGRFSLSWEESNGPAVSPPARRGFGSSLLRRILPGDLKGIAEIDYAETGLRYALRNADPMGIKGSFAQ